MISKVTMLTVVSSVPSIHFNAHAAVRPLIWGRWKKIGMGWPQDYVNSKTSIRWASLTC